MQKTVKHSPDNLINHFILKWKWFIISLLALVIIIAGVAIYLNLHWKHLLTQRIKEAIANSTDSLYTIDFEDINTNIITGNVSIKHIVFKPDTAVYQQLKRGGIAPRHIYSVEVAQLTLRKVHPLKIYFNRYLKMQSILIDKPVIKVWFDNIIDKRDTLKKDDRNAYQRLSRYLKSIDIADIVFKEVDFKYIDRSVKKHPVSGLKNLTIKITDLLVDSLSQYDKSRFYYTKDIFMQLKDYEVRTKDSLYTVKLKDLTASTAKSYAKIGGMQLEPRYPEMVFAKKVKVQKNRYSMYFNEILLNKINFKLLNTERKLIASNLIISDSNIDVFLSRALPLSTVDKASKYPQMALKNFGLNTNIETITLKNVNISYTEFNPLSQQKGKVFFRQINGRLLNVTNDSIALLKNHFCTAHISTLLMNKARLNSQVTFDLTATNASFTYSGNVGRMNAQILNPVMRPLALIEIKSGNIIKMNFSGKGDIKGSTGNVVFYYKNLNVTLLKKDTNYVKLKKKGLTSIMANALIIKNDNPLEGEALRMAAFSFQRPLHASFFNLMWKGILSGIMETIGFGEATQKKMQLRIQQLKVEKGERLERREDRKLKRNKRRAKGKIIEAHE